MRLGGPPIQWNSSADPAQVASASRTSRTRRPPGVRMKVFLGDVLRGSSPVEQTRPPWLSAACWRANPPPAPTYQAQRGSPRLLATGARSMDFQVGDSGRAYPCMPVRFGRERPSVVPRDSLFALPGRASTSRVLVLARQPPEPAWLMLS